MARETFKIEGLKELDRALQEFPKATSRNVLLRTLKGEGQVMADAGERNAPRGLTGQLADSYTIGTRLSRRQKRQAKKDSPVEVYVGPTPHAKSVQTEFGNVHQAAHPHLRPAFDGTVMTVLKGVTARLTEEIEKARTRIAKKAARDAAKMKT